MTNHGVAALLLAALLSLSACTARESSAVSGDPVQPPVNSVQPAGEEDAAQEAAEEPLPAQVDRPPLPDGWRTYEFQGLAVDVPANWSETRDDSILLFSTEDGPGISLSCIGKDQAAESGQGTLDMQRDAFLQGYGLSEDRCESLRVGEFDAIRIDLIDDTIYTESEDGEMVAAPAPEGEARVIHYLLIDMGDRFLTCFGMYTEMWSETYGAPMQQVLESLRISEPE